MRANTASSIQHVALIGYGEVGQILAEDLRAQHLPITAYDLKLEQKDNANFLQQHAAEIAVVLSESHSSAVNNADLIISAVTASETESAAEASAAGIKNDAFYLDFNSASPEAKKRAAKIVNRCGGCYVEGAVMTSVPPHRIQVPLLLGGEFAAIVSPQLNKLGFRTTVVEGELGTASAIKMCRSVMIKGMEALVIESLTAARAYGVEAQVIASLQETFPEIQWEQQANYFFQRVIQHGRRRSEEMFEAAATVTDTGLTPRMSDTIAKTQGWMAEQKEAGLFDNNADNHKGEWRTAADHILQELKPQAVKYS